MDEPDIYIAEVVTHHAGGRADIDKCGWKQKEEYSSLSEKELQNTVEQLRHQLLQRRDIRKVKKALADFGISENSELIATVKRYNFDSPGITFTPDNYDCWNKIVRGKGTIRDAQYLVHEMAEVRELQRIKEQNKFDFMGLNFEQMSRKQKRQWTEDFRRYYMQSHRKALESEYKFIAKQVSAVINDTIQITPYLVASIDFTRSEARVYMLLDGVPLEEHPKFDSWQQCGQKTVEVKKGAKKRLGIRLKNPTLQELVQAVKQVKLKQVK